MGVKKIDCCGDTTQPKRFPKLMKNNRSGAIGLFVEACRGTMILPGPTSNRKMGYSLGDTGWVDTNYWSDYNEPLTLQNE
jgi:hypothetical protein